MNDLLKVGAIAVLGAAASSALADGDPFPLDLSSNGPLQLFSQNSNDGYAGGRGIVFTADESLQVNGAALYTKSSNGLNATFELYEIVQTNGNVLGGATLVASNTEFVQGGLGFLGTKFAPVTLDAGQDYLIRVLYAEAADENHFYEFDPDFFGDAPIDLGPVTVIDGTSGGNTSNFVAPFMSLQVVPAPSALALLGLGGIAAMRRRR